MVLATAAVVACAVESQAATVEAVAAAWAMGVTLAVVAEAHGSRRTLSTRRRRHT